MTPRSLALLCPLLLLACKGDGAPKSEPRAPTGPAAPSAPASAPKGSAREVAGSWARTLVTLDENANDRLDETEREPLKMAIGYTALKIEPDGKCEIEKKDKQGPASCSFIEEDGKEYLVIEPDIKAFEDEMDSRYRILSRSDKELLIKDPTGPQGAMYLYDKR